MLTKNKSFEQYIIFRKPIFSKIKKQNHTQSKEKEQEYAPQNDLILPTQRSWNPWNYKVGNSIQATKLYYKILNRYLRLLALEKYL